MLTIPPFARLEEFRVTAYVDDAMWWKFYLIPDYVSIRRDINGKPVFLLIEYAFSDQDRADNKNLPKGGGFMVFDTEMKVLEADTAKIRVQLQKMVDDKWNQLKAIADGQGQNIQGYRIKSWDGNHSDTLSVDDVQLGLRPDVPEAPPGDKSPTVIIADPLWSSGTFHISAPQSDALVSHRVVDGQLSLVGSNVASANMDLTSAGATFMRKTLLNTDGTGGTDLTPIQVVYNLKMKAKLPPITVDIKADTRKLHSAIKDINHTYDPHTYGPDTMSHYEAQLSMAIQSGLIQVHIDTGLASLTDDVVQKLNDMAQQMVENLIKSTFFDKTPPPQDGSPTSPDPSAPQDDGTKDFIKSHDDIYYFKANIDFESTHFEFHERIDTSQDWPVNPQGTLQTFLAGVSAAEMKKYVRLIDLTDPFFATLGLTVTAFANWSEPIDFVECQLQYNGTDENGQQQQKVQTFTLTKAQPSGFWDPRLLKNSRRYSYRWRIGYSGHGTSDFSEWKDDTTPNLNLAIVNPGRIAINVLAGNIDFTQHTKLVQVEMKFEDSNVVEAVEGTTLQLAAGQPSGNYVRDIFIPWKTPVQYKTHFFLKNDMVIDGDWQNILADTLPINEPFIDHLDVSIVPGGNWNGVALAIVNVAYNDDANNYHVEETFQLKTLGEYKSWQPLLRDSKNRKFRYKVLATFTDGSSPFQTDWADVDASEGSQTVPIVVQQHPYLDVKIFPALVDFKVTPIVECSLHYDDTDGHVHKADTFPLTKTDTQEWDFVIANDSKRTYSYAMTYHTADSKTVAQPATTTDDNIVVVSALDVPKISCLVFPTVVSFVETPVVQVNVTYSDPVHNINFEDTLIFTDSKSQQFSFQVDAASPRAYNIAVTYFLANGQIANRTPVTLDQTQIVIPRYVAAAS